MTCRRKLVHIPIFGFLFIVGSIFLVGLDNVHAQNQSKSVLSDALSREIPEDLAVAKGQILKKRTRIRQLRGALSPFRLTRGVFEGRGERSHGLQMSYDYRVPVRSRASEKVSEKPVLILIHGVADSRADLAKLTEIAEKQDWPILRVDTLGHGETAGLLQNQQLTSTSIDYRSDVELVIGLAKTLGIKRAITVGHSKGGGLSLDITRELKYSGIEAVANIPIAPYLSAIDKWFISHTLANDPALFREMTDALAEKWGVQRRQFMGDVTAHLGTAGKMFALAYGRYQAFWKTAMRAQRDLKLKAVDLALHSNSMELAASLSDPMVVSTMKKLFTKYLNLKNEQLTPAKKKSVEEIELLVQGAVAATIGIRDLDFQTRLNPTPLDQTVPTLIITGAQDQVVIPAQVHDHQKFLESQGYSNFEHLELASDHFIPQRHPERVMDEIARFLAAHNLIEP